MGRKRERQSGGSLPDPGAALDRLERAIEARLPASPRPFWAELLVFVLRLVLGRGSWVLGALFVALSAPWFVLPYRQVETMVRAAWYRATANEVAEARVERIELRLLPGVVDGMQRVVPELLLDVRPATGGGSAVAAWDTPLRVRYLPRGERLEAHAQWGTSDALLSEPPRISPGWRLRWQEADAPGPGFDLVWSAADDAWWRSEATWNAQSNLTNVLADLDRPVDLLVGEWTRRADDGLVLPVRSPRGRPDRLFVADALSHLPPGGGSGFGELFGLLVLMVPFGLPFWWAGTRLLARGVESRHRHFFVWVPLALIPLWGHRYIEVIERLSPGAFEENVLVRKAGSAQVLPSSRIETEEPRGIHRQRIDLASSRFAPVLARVDLARPAAPLAGGAAVWRELSARFQRHLLALDDAGLAAALRETAEAELFQGPPALLPVLLETMRQASLDPARGDEVRQIARDLIHSTLLAPGLDLCHPAFAAHREDLERLRGHADGVIAEAAAARLAELDGFAEARLRDWGALC